MPIHIYTSWVVYTHKLAKLAAIPWTQEGTQDFQGQGHSSNVKGSKFHAHAHLPLLGSPQAHIGINSLDTVAVPSSRP